MSSRNSATIALLLSSCLPVMAANSTIKMEATPIATRAPGATQVPAIQMGSITIAASGEVTTAPCLTAWPTCPDRTESHASIPFPSAELAAGSLAYITLMFQDVSYTGAIKVAWGFVQNGAVVWDASDTEMPTVSAGTAYLAYFKTEVATQLLPGSATVIVSISYANGTTRGTQPFMVSGGPMALDSEPSLELLSVTAAPGSTVKVQSCLGGTSGCGDPTPAYVSMPVPSTIIPLDDSAFITYLLRSISYTGRIDITTAYVQNGIVVGEPGHFSQYVEPGVRYLLLGNLAVPGTAVVPGAAAVVVRVNYGGLTSTAQEPIFLQ